MLIAGIITANVKKSEKKNLQKLLIIFHSKLTNKTKRNNKFMLTRWRTKKNVSLNSDWTVSYLDDLIISYRYSFYFLPFLSHNLLEARSFARAQLVFTHHVFVHYFIILNVTQTQVDSIKLSSIFICYDCTQLFLVVERHEKMPFTIPFVIGLMLE